MLRALLAAHPLVASCFDAPPGRGGWGATIVVLRTAGAGASSPADG
jgi:DNA-nicking Smr family endonuclease